MESEESQPPVQQRRLKLRIPQNITREHILEAFEEIKKVGWPPRNNSTTYDVLDENGERFPPKIVVMYANKYANGELFDVNNFSGGEATTNRFFRARGFRIEPKEKGTAAEYFSGRSIPRVLEIYQEYSRKEIHDIFDPGSQFTSQGGTWGLRGIINYPSHSDNFILFVTLNRPDLGMTIDEGVTESGILIWQSEPQQKLSSKTIKKLLAHDDRKNSIILFLRANRHRDYCYFGRLKFVSRKPNKEEPVQITWQILDWDFSRQQAEQIELALIADEDPAIEKATGKKIFSKEDPPENSPDGSVDDSRGVGRDGGKSDYAGQSQKNAEIGLLGELAVIEIEKANLRTAGVADLIEKIIHVSKTDDTLGYDIRSVTPKGEIKLIEVKTTTGGKNQPFILTRAEIRRYQKSAQCYHLYRLFNFKEGTNIIRYYTLEGDLTHKISREPLQYSCKPLGKEMKATPYLENQ
jgi:hypothetical protein